MKIKRVSFEHLNSILVPCTIDFDAIGSGLFLITGPTGSGKSTILDAITLALFGQTSRQGAITSGSNEVMTKGENSCHSTVVFEEGGDQYEVSWSQRRRKSRKGEAEGSLEAPKRSLKKNGELLADGLKDVDRQITSILGMGFNQFTQAVLLAQGGFNSFLAAEPKDKGAMLTQLTKMDIYQRIGKAVYQKYKELDDQQKEIDTRKSEIHVLKQEERTTLELTLQELEKRRQELAARGKMCTGLLADWEAYDSQQALLQTIAETERQVAQLAREGNALQEAYRKSEALLPFLPLKTSLQNERVRAAKLGDELAIHQRKLDQAKEREAQAQQGLQQARQMVEEGTRTLERQRSTLGQAKESQAQLGPLQDNLENARKQLASKQAEISQETERYRQLRQSEAHLQKELELACAYLQTHLADSHISESLPKLESGEETLQSQRALVDQTGKTLDSARRQLEETGSHITATQTTISQLQDQEHQLTARHSELTALVADVYRGKRSEELRAERDKLKEANALAKLVMSMEEQRRHLIPDSPCPLCGSRHHPYAEGQPLPGGNDQAIRVLEQMIPALQGIEKELQELETHLTGNAKDQKLAKETLAQLAGVRERQAQTLREAKACYQQEKGKIDELEARYQELLAPYGLHAWDAKAKDTLLQRKTAWEGNVRIRDDGEQRKAFLEQQTREQRQKVEALSASGEEQAVTAAQAKLEEKEQQIADLLGGASIEDFALRIHEDEDRLQKSLQAATDTFVEAQSKVKNLASTIATLQDQQEQALRQARSLLQELLEKVAPLGISREEEFDSRILTPQQRQLAVEQAKILVSKRQELQGYRNQLPEPLRVQPATTRDALRNEQDGLQIQTQETDKKRGEIEEKLRSDDGNSSRRKELEAEYGNIHAAFLEWKQLNDLIGDAEGSKFQKFAQNISFKVLVGYANQQLERLDNRYQLRASDDNPLTVSVYDASQGTERTASNLSGGESFLVSLALALGLAAFSPGKSPIESLFLDEGFGTLDQETLGVAMRALASLHHEGKQIGIISHVGQLREELPIHIEVSKDETGHSRLSGPGVRCP